MTVFDGGRPKYGRLLERVLDTLNVKRILTLLYNIDKRGHVQVDVLTFQNIAYSFSYDYGNLEFGQDVWDQKTDDEIMHDMMKSAKRFASLRLYYAWRTTQLFEQ